MGEFNQELGRRFLALLDCLGDGLVTFREVIIAVLIVAGPYGQLLWTNYQKYEAGSYVDDALWPAMETMVLAALNTLRTRGHVQTALYAAPPPKDS